MAMLPTDDLAKRLPPAGWAPFALGFRPFFLAAGLYAVLMMA
ncbi:MAG: NnrS family protein, partial [Proteobacteria bacterium]|nr:NnrS family protein [Pseudomonadota bacterium]